jgi:hypothetical protein
VVIGRAERKTIAEAGERYVQLLATVKRRKSTTLQDHGGYLRRHLVPHFGEHLLDRIEPEHVERYLDGEARDAVAEDRHEPPHLPVRSVRLRGAGPLGANEPCCPGGPAAGGPSARTADPL